MTTDDHAADPRPGEADTLNRNLVKIEELSQRLVAAMANRKGVRPSLQAPAPELYMKAASAYMTEMMANPSRLIENQVSFWGKALTHYVEAQQMVAQGKFVAPKDDTPKDRRFTNELWQTHPYFNYVKQQYLMTAEAIESAVSAIEGLDGHEQQRLAYFSKQIIDLFSPANFLGTNPDALSKAVETDGQSLVDGLENMVRDIEKNDGELLVTLSDKGAFDVGGNIATAEGSVVYRNHMFELIQFAPTTETVHKTPLLIFPPWINKFYILDMKPKNSLIRWIVDQGFTLFVVSWKNPDASYRDVSMLDYVNDGFLEALAQVKAITAEDRVNAVGYCIGGTTLSLTLAAMARRGDKSVNSATFFTTLTDFAEPGEIGVFLDDDFVDGIADEVTEKGYLDSFFISRTFSYLRSNDLIYGPAIRSYMLGEAPPAFDLLFWNGDGTNLPARMAVEYLRCLCQRNDFAGDGFQLGDQTLKLRDIKVPVCAIACETDHIAPWKSSYDGIRQMGSRSKTFILSESGHIAGIVNPPTRQKYGHYTNESWPGDADAWMQDATYSQGSWWPRWRNWLAKRSGRKVPARRPGDGGVAILAAAPGTYVKEVPDTGAG